ncbi:MAG: D-glycero-beta-D-manno-heptose-7-phosphate kinase [Candidatus Omnitrophota bacterium]|nr:D-glycero-beta-D-manno-heptose-7-phosphate kinase [Candidatus Omnitrophota bacterium]
MNISKIKQIISRFHKAKVLVIGDLILDEFIWGKVDRISPEAPVPVVRVESESFMPGGASNVANNIAALGAKVYLSGITGNDKNADILRGELKKKGIDLGGVIIDGERPTTLKTRIIAHHQQVVRVDRESAMPIEDNLCDQILTFIRQKIDSIDALIIEDYGKGLITARLLSEIIPLARKHKKIITVDPKIDHFSYYKGITSITPNTQEAEGISGIKIKVDADIDRVGKKIINELGSESVLLTLGENGMRLFTKDGRITHISTVAQEVFDVSGAGDTVIATFTLSLSCGAKMQEAAYISNYAAGIVVGKVGVAVVTKEELFDKIK